MSGVTAAAAMVARFGLVLTETELLRGADEATKPSVDWAGTRTYPGGGGGILP